MMKMLAVKKFLFYYQSNPYRRGKLRSLNNSAFIMKKVFLNEERRKCLSRYVNATDDTVFKVKQTID